MNSNSSFLNLIDWDEISKQLRQRAYLKDSKQKIAIPIDFKSSDSLDQYYNSIEDKVTLILESKDRHIYSLLNFLASLEEQNEKSVIKLSEELLKNKHFSIRELNTLVYSIESYQELFSRSQSYILLDQKIKNEFNKNLLKPFRKICNEQCEIFYDRHPLITPIHEEIVLIESKLRKMIQKCLNSDEYKTALQIENYDVIYDRYVLLIRSDNYQSKMGSILYHSESGKTLYVEPYEIAQLANKRVELISKRDEILNKICREFSDFLFKYKELVNSIIDELLEFDIQLAKAQFSLDYNLTRPELREDYAIEIQEGFHPFIEDCIPNDIYVDYKKLGLVISGPNTGGKTVLLKIITISHLFPNLGLFVPAKFSKIKLLKNIYYMGNDQQNLSEGLSSFSAEARNYCSLIEELSSNPEDSLIVIDEIFNSTSSEDASSLALALFEEIEKLSNSKIFVSTHHQMLKTFTHQKGSFISSHVGFDLSENQPTYKLIHDLPGASMAIQIFQNLAKDLSSSKSIAERAEKYLDNKLVTYEKLLNEISQKNIHLDKLILENSDLNKQLKNQKDANEGILKLKMQDTFQNYQSKFDKLLDKLKTTIDENKKNPGLRQNTKGLLDSFKSEFISFDTRPETQSGPNDLKKIELDEIKEGMKLYSKSLNKVIKVQKIDSRKKKVISLNGVMKIELGIDDLFKSKQAFINYQEQEKEVPKYGFENFQEVSLEVDCRGFRLNEFENLVEKQLSFVLSGHIPYTTIIHGHGDGILKSWLKKRIKSDKNFIMHDSNEGNDGASTIKLK